MARVSVSLCVLALCCVARCVQGQLLSPDPHHTTAGAGLGLGLGHGASGGGSTNGPGGAAGFGNGGSNGLGLGAGATAGLPLVHHLPVVGPLVGTLLNGGTYGQYGRNAGALTVSPDGQSASLRFAGVGSPGACAIGSYLAPIHYHTSSGLINLSIPDLVVHNLALNVLGVVDLRAEAAVLNGVVSVSEDLVTDIRGTIALEVSSDTLPILGGLGMDSLLAARLSLIIPLALHSLDVNEPYPAVC